MTTTDPMHDQALAALDEAARLVRSAPGARVRRTPVTSRVLSRWIGESDDWSSCGHLPTPQVCFGLGNWPGYLMCGPCLLNDSSMSDTECDWCGADPQTDTRVKLYGTAYPIGPAIVIFMFCDQHIVQPDCGAYKGTAHP